PIPQNCLLEMCDRILRFRPQKNTVKRTESGLFATNNFRCRLTRFDGVAIAKLKREKLNPLLHLQVLGVLLATPFFWIFLAMTVLGYYAATSIEAYLERSVEPTKIGATYKSCISIASNISGKSH
ncbi:MAG: hypothetical protein SAL70_19705, partial [Scytonema sp. PMC 1070.18]|nr:hypothetical protein [Scytonema sp. PMC 1070.18]